LSYPKRRSSWVPGGLPLSIGELFGQMRVKGFNAAGNPVKLLAENDGTLKSSLYGKNSSAALKSLRVNSDDQLQVEVVAGPTALGQVAPNATTETDLYEVPASKTAKINSLWICNRSTTATFRLGVSVGGGALANEDYLFYDVAIPSADTLFFASDNMISMSASDKIIVYASTANLTFAAFGVAS